MKTVNVVIPCRDEAAYIGACLDSLIATSYPKDLLTICVCDGMSSDETPNIVLEYSERFPYIKLLKNEHRTTPYALNLGIKEVQSDVSIILGAHSTVAPDFIDRNCEALFSSEEVGCAGGLLENSYENHLSKIIGFAMSQSFGVGNAYFRTGSKAGFVDTVAFGSYKREVFEKVGYFDESLTRNQDDEFNFRLKKAGYKILLDPSIRSYYVVRSSYQKLFRQYFQYGYWKVFVNQKHKMITTVRQLVPFFFVAFLVVGLLLSVLVRWIAAIYGVVLLCYLLAALSFASKFKGSLRDTFAVVWAFLVLHISYGSGYWIGVWDFLVCKKKPFYEKSSR